jgi:outer membrane protein TolC
MFPNIVTLSSNETYTIAEGDDSFSQEALMKFLSTRIQILRVSCIVAGCLCNSLFANPSNTNTLRILSFATYIEEFNAQGHITKINATTTLTALERKNGIPVLPDPVFQVSKMDNWSFSLTQNMPWPALFSAERNLRDSQFQLARISENAAKAEQHWLAANDFLTWISLHKELENSLQNLESWNKIRTFAETRQQQGLGWHGDMVQIQIDLEMAKSRTIALENDIANLRDMMRLRIGDTAGTSDFDKEWPKDWLRKNETESGLSPDFETQRLTLLKTEQLALLNLSKATELPNWSLGATWTKASETMGMPGFMVGVRIPLFSWPTISRIESEKSLTESLFKLRESQRNFEKRTALLVSARRSSQAHNNVETLQKKLLPLAEQHLKITLSEFAAGKKKITDLIAAEKSVRAFKAAETQAMAQLARENLLHKAIADGIATFPSAGSVPQLSLTEGALQFNMQEMGSQNAQMQSTSQSQNSKTPSKRTQTNSTSESAEESTKSRSSTMGSMGM